jgi:hypothetical protein
VSPADRLRRHLKLAEPLPECEMCTRPTRRDAYRANGGLCTSCTDDIAAINHRLAQQHAEAKVLRPLFPVEEP